MINNGPKASAVKADEPNLYCKVSYVIDADKIKEVAKLPGKDGGAIYVCVGTDDVVVKNCKFSGNKADYSNDNVDGRSDTHIIKTGSTVSTGSLVIIIVLAVALVAITAVLVITQVEKKKMIANQKNN